MSSVQVIKTTQLQAKLDHFGKGLKDLIQQALIRVKSSSLSPEAKDAINQMAAVVKNKGQTVPQAKAAMKVVMSKTPKHVTAEINKYMQAHEQEALDKILKLQN
ncbi:unnamed protein product [Anisakis simplex]|uniref:Stage VI sporulation protein F n=1 Tax=Anisakis simplex TaxID=6269 RepID=A0A0M3K7H9_ANISI|nr:unnamed protein product [Anisakis simplex]